MEVKGDKALQPDGFFFRFAQYLWDLLREDILGLFKLFHSLPHFDHNFRNPLSPLFLGIKAPILWMSSSRSRFGWVYKLIVYVLKGRLHQVMDSLVSFTQIAFIRGHNIHDDWISISEVVDIMKRSKSGIIFKLDFEKAYDSVSWDIKWIRYCVLCATVSILVNGTHCPKFNIERSRIQGYPLSPLLFNLVAETLPTLINQCQSQGWFHRIPIPGLLDRIIVLQFADDIILFLNHTNGLSSRIQCYLTIYRFKD